MGLILSGVLALLLASQFYWAWRVSAWVRRAATTAPARLALGASVLGVYLLLFAYNFGWFGRGPSPTRLTLVEAILGAPFQWWIASSLCAFLVVVLLSLAGAPVAAAAWLRRKFARRDRDDSAASPDRRQFLARAGSVAVGAPFVAGAYGLLYGRLNLETTRQRIRLASLPEAFEGFHIAQLSDIHVGPFMPEEEIRKYAAIANALKPDLTVLTGDFVTWDPSTQQAVVRALAGLRAPFGVFGSLGNHDFWSRVEDSLPLLFQQAGIRILRYESAPIATQGEEINLIGADFETRRPMGPSRLVRQFLTRVEPLVAADRVNILLSHNPDTFDRAAELGIGLSLAGHTHGGQAALEFISPQIAPSRLVTPYVAGWFERPGGQLYVNRGIGTIGVPIRIGAPPEITVFELTRG